MFCNWKVFSDFTKIRFYFRDIINQVDIFLTILRREKARGIIPMDRETVRLDCRCDNNMQIYAHKKKKKNRVSTICSTPATFIDDVQCKRFTRSEV